MASIIETSPSGTVTEVPKTSEGLPIYQGYEWMEIGDAKPILIKNIPLKLDGVEGTLHYDILNFDLVDWSISPGQSPLEANPRFSTHNMSLFRGTEYSRPNSSIFFNTVFQQVSTNDDNARNYFEFALKSNPGKPILVVKGHGGFGSISQQDGKNAAPYEDVLDKVDTGKYGVIIFGNCHMPTTPWIHPHNTPIIVRIGLTSFSKVSATGHTEIILPKSMAMDFKEWITNFST